MSEGLGIEIGRVIVMVLPLLFAVSVHEAAHGWAAWKMGDDTAAEAGRITLNPIRHIDPFGSIVLPLLLALTGAPIILGYAKPVPINFARLTDFRKGTIWVSVAGILANLALLVLSGLVFRLLFWAGGSVPANSTMALILVPLLLFFGYSVIINAILAVFNMIPIPPLDGSRLISVFLPLEVQKRLASIERFGILLVLILLIVKADLLFKVIFFFIAPLLIMALGETGLAFVASVGR